MNRFGPWRVNPKRTKEELQADIKRTYDLAKQLEDQGKMSQAARGFARLDALEAKLEQMEKQEIN